MNYTEYLYRIDDAKQDKSYEEYLGNYGYPADCPYDADTLIIWARIIFAAAHNDWRELVAVAGEKFDGLKNAAAFARHFEIPYQSLRCWNDGRRKPPTYIIQLAGYALISELPTEENQDGDV